MTDALFTETHRKTPRCTDENCDGVWHDCPECDEGYVEADCGEDTCCCADPSDHGFDVCDTCHGRGSWPCPSLEVTP